MTTRLLILSLVCGLMFTAHEAVSQAGPEAEITNLIQHRIDLINLAHSAPRSAELVNLHAKEFQASNTTYLPDGTFEQRTLSLEDFKRVLSNYADSDSHKFSIKLNDIPFIRVFDKTGVAIYTASYTMNDMVSGQPLYGSDQIITVHVKSTPDGWKFVDQHVTEIRDKINKYPCTYELYQKDENEMLVNVKFPAGNTFKHEYIDINFNEVSSGVYMVRTNVGDEFAWENNTLRALTSDNSSELTSRPNSKYAVCKDIVMYYHSGSCSDLRQDK